MFYGKICGVQTEMMFVHRFALDVAAVAFAVQLSDMKTALLVGDCWQQFGDMLRVLYNTKLKK